ncbi:MAG: diacylglycerol kinase family lipid kinase [Caldilineales bacterium]|nr:diacylglycerol kinase family lipid kinase [Caldilineales bacterium]MDW8316524.1 diacylglycerol kinase family lipid kinase [Anaerolineae bacterium]
MRAALVLNPTSGFPHRRQELPEALDALMAAGWTVDIFETESAGDTERLAADAAQQGYEAVLAGGGDGTVHHVANGLLAVRETGRPIPRLGVLPLGTANVLAHDLDLTPLPQLVPRPLLIEAAQQLARSLTAWIDVGRVTLADGRQRHFVCWAGVGLDAAVAAAVENQLKAKGALKPAAYALSTLRELGRADTVARYRLRVDRSRWSGHGVLAVVSNIRHYALVLSMAPQAYLNDGLLDVVLFQGTMVEAVVPLMKLLTGLHIQDAAVGYAQACRVEIETDPPRPVHLDAEPYGSTPIAVEVLPQALPVLMPLSAASRNLRPHSDAGRTTP